MSIWNTLSTINCNEYVDKKGQFSYLSWTWAWATVKQNYPAASYVLEDDIVYPDGTMEVRVTVRIEDESNTMWLPVLDFKNKAIQNPNAFDINSSRMRCLVKCLAMFGLGHYIYAGESLPQEQGASDDDWEDFLELLSQKDAVRICEYTSALTEKQETDLFNMAPQGQKTKFKATVREFEKECQHQVEMYVEGICEGMVEDESAVVELLAELSEDKFLKGRVWNMLSPVQQHELKAIIERNAE